jgi:leader peptidase (prepilin peptidase) / N-methyltransferase
MLYMTAVALITAATAVLFYLTYMDVRYYLLPNKGNLALAILGLVFRFIHIEWSDVDAIQSVILDMSLGALCGAGIFLITRWVSLKWKGVEGIGMGDVKFSAAAGIWLGPAGVGLMIGGAAFLLLIFGFGMVALKRRTLKDYYLPFGAAAAPATAILLWAQFFGVVSF